MRHGSGSLFEMDLGQVAIGDPTEDDDAATKRYVDTAISDLPAAQVRMNFRGAWNNATTYATQDVVLHAGGVWVSSEDDLVDVEPGSPDTEAVWVALQAPPSEPDVKVILPTEGTQTWTWAGDGLTAEALDGIPPYNDAGNGGGDIAYTGTFNSNSTGHSLYVTSGRGGVGAIGFRFDNPGPGLAYDADVEVLNTDSAMSLALYQVSDDGGAHASAFLCSSGARLGGNGQVSLWRFVVRGTDGPDPTVLVFRRANYNV